MIIVNKQQVVNKGIRFGGLLTIAFIILKLLDKITWSWVWVLSPLWIPPVAYFIFILIGILLIAIGINRSNKKANSFGKSKLK